MSAILPTTEHRIPKEKHCSVALRVSNQTLVILQLLAVDIRSHSGVCMTRSAILRGLIRWMEACDIDTREVRSSDALRAALLMTISCEREA